jgi:hypothetical protein
MSIIPYHKNIDKYSMQIFFEYWSKSIERLLSINSQEPIWDFSFLCTNKYITFEIINEFFNDYDTNVVNFDISENPNITWDIVKSHPDIGWMFRSLSSHPNITLDIVKENPCPPNDDGDEWDYDMLSQNPNITWDIVQSNPEIEWNYHYLSKNPNITWDIVRNNPDKHWNYYILSENINITWDIVRENPDIPWDYSGLSENPNINWEIVKNNPDKDWDYDWLSGNPNITWEIVQSNPEKDWNYKMLSSNPNITWDIVKENLDKPWNYYFLSGNPNITLEIIQSNPKPFPMTERNGKCMSNRSKHWDCHRVLANTNFIDYIVIEKIRNIISHFRTNITEELMMYVWNPTRVEKWKYLLDNEEQIN